MKTNVQNYTITTGYYGYFAHLPHTLSCSKSFILKSIQSSTSLGLQYFLSVVV